MCCDVVRVGAGGCREYGWTPRSQLREHLHSGQLQHGTWVCVVRAHVCTYMCACNVHVEVRGQPTRVNSLLPPCRSQKQTRVIGLGCSCLYLLNHLNSPEVGVFDLGLMTGSS